MILTSTDILRIVSTSTVTLDVVADWIDLLSGAVTPGRTVTAMTASTTTYDVVAAPAGSTYRKIKLLNIRNKHATLSNLITVQLYNGSITGELYQYTLQPGETLWYDESGWHVIDSSGGLKDQAASGRYLGTTLLTSSTTFTTGSQTNKIRVQLQGGGGQGGGCTIGSASISGAAGGGSAGGFAQKTFAVAPNTTYTYGIGSGGSTSTAGANTGQVGGNTTFTVGATTVTAIGGNGGLGCTSAATVTTLGGATPSVSTNGDINCGGMPGEGGFVSAVGVARSGCGGSSQFGAGGNALKTQGTGVAASVGYGGGGSGGCAIGAVAAVAGGVGTNGCIIIDEYS